MGNHITKLFNIDPRLVAIVKETVFIISSNVLKVGFVYGLNCIESRIHTSNYSQNEFNIIKRIYKDGDGLYGFCRGLGFPLFSIDLILKSYQDWSCLKRLLLYSLQFIDLVIALSPMDLHLWDILIQSNTFCSMFYYMVLEGSKEDLISIVSEFPIFKDDRYSRIILTSLAICPLSCIQAHYSQGIANSSPNLLACKVNSIYQTFQVILKKNGIIGLFKATPFIIIKSYYIDYILNNHIKKTK